MGFYPKHLKRRRQHRRLCVVSAAYLSGMVLAKEHGFRRTRPNATTRRPLWVICWPDGQESYGHHTKFDAAVMFLNYRDGKGSR